MAETQKKAYSDSDKEQLRGELFKIGSETTSKNIFYSIKSRYKILYIVSSEEERVIKYFQKFCISEAYSGYIWDCSRGLIDIHSDEQVTNAKEEIKDEEAILSYVIDQIGTKKTNNGHIYLLLDYHRFLDDAEAPIERKLKEFANYSETDMIVIVAPEYICGSTLDKEMTVIDFPYPSKFEIESVLENIKNRIALNRPAIAKVAENKKEELIHAVTGLTLKEAKNAFGKTIVQDKTFRISTLLREKELSVKKSGLLEICNPDISMEDVGGLDVLKDWLMVRKVAFCDDARNFGLPPIRGFLLAGVAGCGKSLTAKAVASLFEIPLLRLDMGAMFGSRVGESERNIREALKTVESIAPCVTGDTKILLADGTEKTIEDMYNSQEEHYNVWSLNKETLEKEIDIVDAITKREVFVLVEIKTTNSCIKTSVEHKMLVFENGKIEEKEASRIVCEDNICTFDEQNKIKTERVISVSVSCDPGFSTTVFDLACRKNHNFIANSLLSRNCLLWADEIEKGISGVSSSAHTDGGTTARVVSTLLTWLQEKTAQVFTVATANNISTIPPEFMRAGRFDEVFFLDLPNVDERMDIAAKLLRRKKRDDSLYDLEKIAKSCDGYVGAEIEKAIDNALFLCYYENKREMTTDDICSAFKQFIPLCQSRKEEIEAMRSWAKNGGAIMANSNTTIKRRKNKAKNEVLLDIDNEDIVI